MDADTWALAKAIYFELADLPPEQRSSQLASRCGDDEALRSQVCALLDHAEVPEHFLEESAIPEILEAARAMGSAIEESLDMPVGSRVGPYEIQSLVGSGGMGSVYKASRADGQFEHHVAIKIVRKGLDTAEVVDRFRRERQLLAGLTHANIARLLDGGVTDDGRPYIVMEHVEGVPIDEYCEQHSVPIEARLRLFCSVCGAVHFAHQNLVVHRDLKPGNILVDAGGTPKLLDFGIASVLRPDGNDRPEVTIAERRYLTPGFASPEQVLGETVSTASDVYSLGVVLYHVLTGASPYHFQSHTDEEVRRLVCEASPPSPTEIARQTRSPDGGARSDLARRLRGDLDNIVLMAMRKEPQRRYASVEQFAADIERHLAGHPVIARPDTFGYRTGKFLKRNALPVSAAAAVFVAVVAGSVGIAWQAQIANAQKDQALLAKAQAERTKEFIQSVLQSANAFSGPGHDVTVREILDDAAERARTELADQPAVLADALGTIGSAFTSLGEFERAEALLHEALEHARVLPPESANLVTRLADLGMLHYTMLKLDEAEALTREALALAREQGGVSTNVAVSLNNLGAILRAQDRLDEAEVCLREALDIRIRLLGPEDLEVAQTLNNLASLENSRRDLPAAAELLQRSLDIRRRVLGDEHPLIAQSMSNLAIVYHRSGDYERAAPLYVKAIELQRRTLGDDHPDLASVLFAYGMLHRATGDNPAAEPLLREVADIQRGFMDATDTRLIGTQLELALCLRDQGQYENAIAGARTLLDGLVAGDASPRAIAKAAGVLADVYDAAGQPNEADAVRAAHPEPESDDEAL